jgi:hypothetical protein
MSTKVNTVVNNLLKQYTVKFIADVQNLKGGDMSWNTVGEDTDFGVLLHKEGLWSLYKYREEKSLLYHLCRNKYGRFDLHNNPCSPEDGRCSECNGQPPVEIHGLWKLHNFDWIQQNGGSHV